MTLFYPDISGFQAGLDLRGALAVCAKATEGAGYTSPDYGRAKANAASHSTHFTAYHFLLAGGVAAQAAHAHGVVGKTPLMVDVEVTGTSHPGIADTAAFIDAYRKAGGVTHMVYLPHWYWQQIGSPSLKPLHDRDMALVSSAYSAYTDASSGVGWQPYGGMTPMVWQYTDRLRFGGMDIDFNAFRGSHAGDQSGVGIAACLAEFRHVTTSGHLPTAPPSHPAKPAKPEARVASGKESLRHAVNREGTTVPRALWLMAMHHADDGNFGRPNQVPYISHGDYNAIMPKGMTYWVG